MALVSTAGQNVRDGVVSVINRQSSCDACNGHSHMYNSDERVDKSRLTGPIYNA